MPRYVVGGGLPIEAKNDIRPDLTLFVPDRKSAQLCCGGYSRKLLGSDSTEERKVRSKIHPKT